RAIDDPLPFFLKDRKPLRRAEPIHVVEKHITAHLSSITGKELKDRSGVGLRSVDEAASKLLEVLFLQVFRTTRRSVFAVDVKPPEIVVSKRQLREDRFDRVFNELGDPTFVVLFDLNALRSRNSQ